jgi:hypothetical protein
VSLSPSITRPFDAPGFLFTVRCRHPARGHCFARVSCTVSTLLSGPIRGLYDSPFHGATDNSDGVYYTNSETQYRRESAKGGTWPGVRCAFHTQCEGTSLRKAKTGSLIAVSRSQVRRCTCGCANHMMSHSHLCHLPRAPGSCSPTSRHGDEPILARCFHVIIVVLVDMQAVESLRGSILKGRDFFSINSRFCSISVVAAGIFDHVDGLERSRMKNPDLMSTCQGANIGKWKTVFSSSFLARI